MIDNELRLKKSEILYLAMEHGLQEKEIKKIEEAIINKRDCLEYGEYMCLIIGSCEDFLETGDKLDNVVDGAIKKYDDRQACVKREKCKVKSVVKTLI